MIWAIAENPELEVADLIDGLDNFFFTGQNGSLQSFIVRHRDFFLGHSQNRSIQFVKDVSLNLEGDLGADSTEGFVLLGDDATVCFGN
jgi:hypothetical protein